jgi:hypothetical protein
VAYTVVFLWISGLAGATGPAEAAQRDLADFGATRGISFTELAERSRQRGGSAGLAAYDPALVDRLEGELERARTALSALEEEAAERSLSRVEAELLAHPHLPQAAFLMAECFALQAALARPRDAELADQLERSRAALEGRRADPFGHFGSTPVISPTLHSVTLTGIGDVDRVEVDGRELPVSTRAELAPGLHHVRVWRAGRPSFATFLRLAADQTRLHVPTPPLVACSADDLGAVQPLQVANGAGVPAGVACERWAIARREGAGIGVALCERSRCGSFVHWQRTPPLPFAPIAVSRPWLPTWAKFAIVGAAAAAASSVVLWQAGAFDSGNSSAATFRYDGVNPQGLRF